MIKNITITNPIGEELFLDLTRPEDSGFVVRSVSGLGPGKSTVNINEVATNDGGLLNSSRIGARNIVFSLLFFQDFDIETQRQLTYKYFPIKEKIRMLFQTSNRLAFIDGVVESNEPDIFSQTEGCTISVLCPYPFFYSYGKEGSQETIFNGVESMFEFPFSNESLTENKIIFGEIRQQSEHIITYKGDYEVGMLITIQFMGKTGDIVIYNTRTRDYFRINITNVKEIIGTDIQNADEIVINTVKGEKSIQFLRNGIYTNILNAVGGGSKWPTLIKGDNAFYYTSSTGIENINFKVQNQVIYEGL